MKNVIVFSERPYVIGNINFSYFTYIARKYLRYMMNFFNIDRPQFLGHHTVSKEIMLAMNQKHNDVFYNPLILKNCETIIVIAFKNWTNYYSGEGLKCKKIIFGPNVFNSLHREKNLKNLKCEKIFLTPSDWVKKNYQEQYLYKDDKTKFITWPCPINTNYWKPSVTERTRKNKVIIFSKLKKEKKNILNYHSFYKLIKNKLSGQGLIFQEIKYGEYKISKWKKALNSSICTVYFTDHTESQGIALLESWSMNVPTFVRKIDELNVDNWKWEGANSAPYLNDERGKFFSSSDVLIEHINELIKKSKHYLPRNSILDEFGQTQLYNRLNKFL